MLSSITPLGERGRASRWSVTTTAYVVGSVLGGALSGTVLGAVGWLLPLEVHAVAVGAVALLAVAAVLALLVETGRLPALPTWRRQVDEDWLHRYRGWVYGGGYGVQLGLGVVTIVTSPTLYVAFALALLTGSPLGGAVVGGTFGLVRALPVLGMRRVTTTSVLRAVHRRIERSAPVARAVSTGLLAVVAVAATAQVVTTGGSGT